MTMTHREDELQDGRLRELAARLGAAAADRLDVERTARVVLERLRAEPEQRRWQWTQPTWLRVAAAMAVLVGAGVVVREVLRDRGAAAHYVVEELTDLSPDQLSEVLASLDHTLDLSGQAATSEDIEELDAEQLGDVLQMLDG